MSTARNILLDNRKQQTGVDRSAEGGVDLAR